MKKVYLDEDTPERKFVNDDFNWKNANYRFAIGETNDVIKYKFDSLLWRPNDSNDLYLVNSMGYRSDEFIENRDMVFAGCSQTWGDGILKEGIWGNILSKSINTKSYNLGLGGKSAQFIVQNLIAFFKEYGNPKILFCLFPEFTRIEMKSDFGFMKSIRIKSDKTGRQTYNLLKILRSDKNLKYSAVPHIAEDIIPAELIFSINLDYIRMLEIYCELNDIKLFWGTWDKFQDEYLNKNIRSFDFKNYVYLNQDRWEKRHADQYVIRYHKDKNLCEERSHIECINHENCHQELKNIYGKNFDFAMDTDVKNKMWGHIPVHQHVHIAEDFEEALKNASN